jgi:hypothetical protein
MDNEPKHALKDIQKVLDTTPRDFNAICTHAKIIYQLGQFERSLMVWHQARKMKRGSQEVGAGPFLHPTAEASSTSLLNGFANERQVFTDLVKTYCKVFK